MSAPAPWTAALREQPTLGPLLAASDQTGYGHTLREICHQPDVWLDTAERLLARAAELQQLLAGCRAVVLTGSGSSQYAGECLHSLLQLELGIPVRTVPGGCLLLHGPDILPPLQPCLLVSFSRSGNTPESVGAIDLLLQKDPQIRHLVITCNRDGELARRFCAHPAVSVVVLDDRTNDRGLAMTSSFTSLVLAGRALGLCRRPTHYRASVAALSAGMRHLLLNWTEALAALAREPHARFLFLGTGARYGAAREAALKVLELTGGHVITMAETYLGVRHGPMAAIHPDTAVVCFLSQDPLRRAYESDLLLELKRKRLGGRIAMLCAGHVPECAAPEDIVLSTPAPVADDERAVLDVGASQLLAFFRSRAEGLNPDTPSEEGVIQRVVETFPIHPPA